MFQTTVIFTLTVQRFFKNKKNVGKIKKKRCVFYRKIKKTFINVYYNYGSKYAMKMRCKMLIYSICLPHRLFEVLFHNIQMSKHNVYHMCYKKAQLTQGLRATAPSFQDGRQPPSWILSNRK